MSLAEGRELARAVVRRSGSSFLWPMRLLARPQREAIFAVYAYARLLDDIADGDAPVGAKLQELAAWRDEVAAIFAGRPATPLGHALHAAVERFGLPRAAFFALVDGMEMDARGPIRAPSERELRLYCRRVAGAVGLLCITIFGRRDLRAQAFALRLGEALQLTNILRDLEEDAGRGRLYLPRELLAEHGLEGSPAAVLAHRRLADACHRLAVTAERRFEQAAALARRGSRRGLAPALRMMAVYRALLERLRARGFERLDPVRPGRLALLWALMRPLPR